MSETIEAPTDAQLGAPEAEAAPSPTPETAQAASPAVPAAPAAPAITPEIQKLIDGAAAAARREAEARFETRFSAFQKEIAARLPASKTEPEIPDLNADPVGHFAAKQAKTEAELAAIRERDEAARKEGEFVAAYRASAARFAAQTPDFQAAYKHAVGHFEALGAALGIPAAALERQAAESAIAQGRDPAEAIYAVAKAAGFTGRQAPAAGQAGVAAVKAGQAAARSVGQAGAPASGAGSLTVERLASMPFSEFRKLSDDQLRAAFGE